MANSVEQVGVTTQSTEAQPGGHDSGKGSRYLDAVVL